MNYLKDKNIIITGASGGIGNSIVKKLYENGANILASGTKIEKLNELKSNFEKIKILKFDISQVDKIEEFIENATKETPKEGVMIPLGAVSTKEGESIVQVIEGTSVEVRQVEVAEETANYARVIKGLNSGMKVVARFDDELEDGQKIIIK